MSDDEPGRCALCRRRTDIGVACPPCTARVARLLAAMSGLWGVALARHGDARDTPAADPVSAVLPAGPVPGVPLTAVRGASSPDSRPPVATGRADGGTLAQLDPRLALAAWGDRWALPAVGTVAAWTAHLAEVWGQRVCWDAPPETVRHFARDVHAAHRALRSVTGEHWQIVGRCITEDCPGDVLAWPGDREALCQVCMAAYPRRAWLWLAGRLTG